MVKKFYIPIQVAIILLSTSCASVLNSKYQKVAITTSNPNTKVYVDDVLAGQGEVVQVKMKRDSKLKQVKTEVDGFKAEYQVHYQHKKSPLYILSWIPFGIFIYPPLLDYGPKSYNYDKTMAIKNKLAVTSRKPDEKYLYLQTTAFNVKKEDLKFESYSKTAFDKGKKTKKSEQSKQSLDIKNSIFTDAVNNILKKHGYIDTTRTIFKDNTNALYVSADIKSLSFKDVRVWANQFYSPFTVAETSIDWNILDIYGQSKIKKTIKCQSGQFSPDYYDDKNKLLLALLEDAINTSFFELMQMSEPKLLLKKGKVTTPEFDLISLVKPTNQINLSKAQNATVTILNKDSHGSGCLISKDGYIISNFHVVAGGSSMEAVLNDGRKVSCSLVRANEKMDLALLKINEQVTDFYTLPDKLGYSVGDEVYAIGTPNSVELGQTLSKGIISGVRKKEDQEWIQTDVSVNPGNSGGALVNKSGELVGIVNSKLIGFGVEGIAFCIPAQKLFKELKLSY